MKPKDFKVKNESANRRKQGKREYLLDNLTRKMMKRLEIHFQSKINVPRIKHGKQQTIETLINEEALLLAQCLRKKKGTWIPRLTSI